MSTLKSTFSESSDKMPATKSHMAASLFLIGADTRRGLSAEVVSALDVIRAGANTPQAESYLQRYESAAGGDDAPRATALGLKM